MQQHNVLFYAFPSELFRGSISRAIRGCASEHHAANADDGEVAPERALRASNELASFIDGLPIEDIRFVQLLQVSSDSDHFDFSGDGAEFIQKLALDQPVSTDLNYIFTQFVVANGIRPAPAPGESEIVKNLQEQANTNQRAAADRENELQAEIDQLNRKIREDSQETSDLRGEVRTHTERIGELEGELETAKHKADVAARRVSSLEGLADEANRRAAANAKKTARRRKKVAA